MCGFSRDSGEVPVIATAELLVRVGPVALRDTVVVIDSAAEEAIIRFGFQYLAKLLIDPISKRVRFANFPEVTLPLLERARSNQLLTAAATVVVPARSEMIIAVDPPGPIPPPIYIRPFHAAGAMARRFVIAHGYAERGPTRVIACNPSPRPCRIKKGDHRPCRDVYPSHTEARGRIETYQLHRRDSNGKQGRLGR